jgi:uncharacterized protein
MNIISLNQSVVRLLLTLCLSILSAVVYADIQKGEAAYQQEDYETALNEFSTAANQGNVYAQYNLGWMYSHGEGVVKNDQTAAQWYEQAALQEHAPSQTAIGLLYVNGIGVVKNEKTAANWFKAAANQGNANAQYLLGILYDYGRGVAKNKSLAYFWYLLANKNGYEGASTLIEEIEPNLSSSERQTIQKAAEKWKPKK